MMTQPSQTPQASAPQAPASSPVPSPVPLTAGRGPGREHLGSYLVRIGLVSEADIAAALDEQRRTGARLGEVLTTRGLLYEADLARAMADLFHLPYRDLSATPADRSAASAIPELFSRRRHVLAVERRPDALVVAVTDPSDVQTRDDLRVVVAGPVREVVVSETQLRDALALVYEDATSPPPALEADEPVDEEGPAPPVIEDLARSDESGAVAAPAVRLVAQLLRRANDEGASDVHVESTGNELRIRFRIDGMLRDVTTVPATLAPGVLSRLKIVTGMDIAERRRPQDGRTTIVTRGSTVDLRAVSLPTIEGEAVVLRLLRQDPTLLDLEKLGFLPVALGRYEQAFRKGRGLVLVSGPTGSGKSTTLYATVNEINQPTRSTVTVEDPIEYRIAGVKQTQVNTRVGYTFATGLRALLRSDPDTILIGEIRDLETARIAAESALTGHLVLSTLHANDAASSLTRLTDMGLEPYLITSAVECIVAQRLLRRLCPRCRRSGPASQQEHLEMVDLLGPGKVEVGKVLHRPVGCAQCGGTGYSGRIAAHEVLTVDDAIRELVLARRPSTEIAEVAAAHGMQRLAADALEKVEAGETSLTEFKRVMS